MTEHERTPESTVHRDPEEEFPQPAQEIVDPRDPEADQGDDVKISGPREPDER